VAVPANRRPEVRFGDGGLFQANVKKCLTIEALRDQLRLFCPGLGLGYRLLLAAAAAARRLGW
jgi:hypothetical protein